jgi:hypothetical protein
MPTSYIGGALVRLGDGGKQQEALPVRVYTVVQYTHKTTRRTKVFAVGQGGEYRHDTVPTNNSTSAITKDFRIKKSRNGVAATPNHPRYRLVSRSALEEICLIVPNLKKGQDALLADPSQYEAFLLVDDYSKWWTIFYNLLAV